MLQEIRVCFSSCDGKDGGGQFRVQLTDAAGNACGVATDFTPLLTEEDYENLRWYLEEYMDLPDGGAVVRAGGIEQQLHLWGRRMYHALFAAPANRALLEQLLDSPEPRVLTIATDQSALLRLPWELLADDAGNLAQRVSVRRQLATPQKNEPRSVPLPLRMLYIVSRPSDTGFIDPRMTTKALFAALDPLGSNVRIDFCRPPTLAHMEEMLRAGQTAGQPYHVVHFDGHGTFLPEAGIGALCFEKPDDGSGESQTDLVRADRLGNLLAQHQIPLVVLEACRSAAVGKTSVFRSVAPRLIQAGVDSVLSMGHAVHVEAARVLLDRFYRELVRGTTIGHAVAQGRSALVSASARWIESGPRGRTITLEDWFLPHLYQRGSDKPLFPRDAATLPRQYDLFLSHNHNDKVRVESLARRLVQEHGLRVWFDEWEAGSGKLKPQCEAGIRDSRFTVVAGSQAALSSNWVKWEIEKHHELNPEGDRLLPIKFEPMQLPKKLNELRWLDFTDARKDADNAELLSREIRSADAEDARRRRGFRPPPEHGQTGCFPRPPQYGFQGRARELYDLERQFRRQRGIVLHAMGGMGKTTLATEAALWWTRSGLFRDGACFASFEQFASADRVVQVLGSYCEGPKFDQRPAVEQRRRAIEFFHERDVLMVWDNFESVLPQFNDGAAAHGSPYTDEERRRLADLFHDLTTGPGRGCLLVTCRPGETGLPGAQKMELHGLARPDSLWLLHRILERDGLTLSDPRFTKDNLDPLLRDLADHPLSLELVGPHLRTLTPEAIRADFGKLLEQFQQTADQSRNRSLLASLEFSRRHLSSEARAALPWLALFSGGVFEAIFLDVSQTVHAAWETIRREFEGIGLLRVEDDIELARRPFLRFHPTLAVASADLGQAEQPEIRKLFVLEYANLTVELDKALRGSLSRSAMTILDREEMNYRTAIRWAIKDGQHAFAAAMGRLFSMYLRRSGRLRECEFWVEMLRDVVSETGFTEAAAHDEREYAGTPLTEGDPQGAIEKLEVLIERLRTTTEFDSVHQLALEAVVLCKKLVESTAGQLLKIAEQLKDLSQPRPPQPIAERVRELKAEADYAEAANELDSLGGTMGVLAIALRDTGRLDEALQVAESALTIFERRGNQSAVANSHVQCAKILMAAGRYDDADARYGVGIAAARAAGNKELEGMTLQHQGMLADDRHQLELATRLYQQALQRFQEAGDTGSMMRTYNLLGVSEYKADRLAEARAWYEKSREVAKQLKDQPGIGAAAQNIGVVCQAEGEAARDRGDEVAARRHFKEARRSLEESLEVWQNQKNKPYEASSLTVLAQIHFLVGDLSAAERHAHAAREIHESLGLKEALPDYSTLSNIAQARGDTRAAAEWARKRDDLRAELQRRAGGGGLPAQLLKSLQQLAIACAQAGFGDGDLGPAVEEALATLDGYPAPIPDFAACLRQVAAGQLPPIPTSLPAELRQILEQLAEAIREAQRQ